MEAAETERPFWDMSWLAVPGPLDAALLQVLGLEAGESLALRDGLARLFEDDIVLALSPPGWTLVLGSRFCDTGAELGPVELCLEASRLREAAHLFSINGQSAFFAWAAASKGQLVRRAVWSDGELVVSSGARAPEEQFDVDVFGEELVCRLATRVAAGPDECVGIERSVRLIVPRGTPR